MRLQRSFIGAGIILAVGLHHQAMAQELKITDYDVPVSRSHQLYVTGNILQQETGVFNYNDYRWEQYGLAGALESFYHSPLFAWQVIAGGGIAWAKQAHQSLKFAENASAAATFRRYLNGRGLFFGGANLQAYWSHDDHRPNLDLGASVGLGRTIEATVLARAIRIDDFLLKEGILNQHLPPETQLELAALIDREGEFKMQYGDTYPVWWYAEMDRLIAAAAALPDGSVGPIGLLRIREVLEQERIQRRAHGWTAEAGITVPVTQAYTSDPGEAAPFVGATFARPLGLKHQVIGEVRAVGETGHALGDYFTFKAVFNYVFELSNRVDVVFTRTYIKERALREFGSTGDIEHGRHQNRVAITAYYYVENSISIRFGGALEHRFVWDTLGRYRERADRTWNIDLSIGYHVL